MKYRKKPVEVEAVQWTGDNPHQVMYFLGAEHVDVDKATNTLYIDTLEGRMAASKGDYIIKGVAGEFYPCKPDIFAQTYEPV